MAQQEEETFPHPEESPLAKQLDEIKPNVNGLSNRHQRVWDIVYTTQAPISIESIQAQLASNGTIATFSTISSIIFELNRILPEQGYTVHNTKGGGRGNKAAYMITQVERVPSTSSVVPEQRVRPSKTNYQTFKEIIKPNQDDDRRDNERSSGYFRPPDAAQLIDVYVAKIGNNRYIRSENTETGVTRYIPIKDTP